MQYTLALGHHQYWLQDFGRELDIDTLYSNDNGLVSVQADKHVGVVFTGQDCGDLPVTVEILSSEPQPDLDDWDEVAETSAEYTGNRLFLNSPYDDTGSEITLPAADGHTRQYRIRIHARGRDAGEEAFRVDTSEGEEFVEWHLIQAWPAPPAPDIQWKLTDHVGKARRGED